MNNKIAKEILLIAKELITEDVKNVLFDINSVDSEVQKLKSGIKAPFVRVSKSDLGGPNSVSVYFTISLDPKENWNNNILENSRYFKMSLLKDGTMEVFSGGSRKSKFRKAKAKSIDDVIVRISKYIGELSKIENFY